MEICQNWGIGKLEQLPLATNDIPPFIFLLTDWLLWGTAPWLLWATAPVLINLPHYPIQPSTK